MKYILLIFVLLLAPIAMAETYNEGQIVLRTNLTLDVNGYKVGNSTKFNITLTTEDKKYEYKDLIEGTNYNEFIEILMVRQLDCNGTRIQQGLDDCFDFFNDYEYLANNITDYNLGWNLYNECRENATSTCAVDSGCATCDSDLNNCERSLTAMTTTKNDIEEEKDDYGSQRKFYAGGFFLLGLIAMHFYRESKNKRFKSPEEKAFGRPPVQSGKPDWTGDIDKMMKKRR